MWLLKAFVVIHLTAVYADTESESKYVPPKPVLKLKSAHTDVFSSEKVELKCDVDRSSDWDFIWKKDGKDLQYGDTLSLSEESSLLTITAETGHAGDYTCTCRNKTGGVLSDTSDSIKITVNDPPTPTLTQLYSWLDVFETEKVALSCEVSSPDWTFAWYKDDKLLEQSSVLSINEKGTSFNINSVSLTHQGLYGCKAQLTSRGVISEISNMVYLKVYASTPKPTVTPSSNFNTMYPGESIDFKCALSVSTGWDYVWYHNRKQIHVSSNGTYNIANLGHSHSGMYQCKARRGSAPFYTEASETTSFQVSDPPTPTLKQQSGWLDVFETEKVALSCEVSSPDWTFTWYKDGELLKKNSVLDINEKGTSFNINSVSRTHKGQYTCKAQLTSRRVSSGFSNPVDLKVYDPPTPTLRQVSSWLDVFENETMALSCEVNKPDWTFAWYKDGELLEQNSVLSINEKGTLFNISSVSRTHQGRYICKAQLTSRRVSSGFSNPVDLKVYASTPKPTVTRSSNFNTMYPGESIDFKCALSVSTGWDYVWYHNGREIHVPSNGTYSIANADHSHSGMYHCKAKRGSAPFYTEASETTSFQVSDPPTPTLKKRSSWLDVFETEKVALSCEVSSPDWTFTWYKDGELLEQNSVLSINEKGTLFNISSVSRTHKGQYTCKAQLKSRRVSSGFSNPVDLKVYENVPVPTLRKSPAFDPMYVGETLTFTCEVVLSTGWNYQWYKDGKELSNTSKDIKLHLSLSDGGEYSCKASRGAEMSTVHSEKIRQNVHEIPVPTLKPLTQWLDVFPGESMKMSCEMSEGSGWLYTWRKDVDEITADNPMYNVDGHTLSIPDASATHHGVYSCSGKLKDRSVTSNYSSDIKLHVYDTTPRVTLMQDPEDNTLHTEDFVSFSCHINVSSGWDYLWYQNNHQLTTAHSGNSHNITSAVMGDTGLFKCQVKRGVTSVFKSEDSQTVKLNIQERPQATITLQTGWSEVFSTDSLVLKCKVTDDNMWNFTWYREGKEIDLASSEIYTVTPQNDPEQGHYTCKGIRNERPFHSRVSAFFKTKNLLLKRRILLSISGCLFFGIIAVFLGCIFLRIFRKPADKEEKLEENDLFVSMKLKDSTDAPCPLVEFITDASMKAASKEMEENGAICSETTPLPITSQEDQAPITDNHGSTENGGGLVSFKQ